MEKEEILDILKSSSGYHAELRAFDIIRKMKIDCDVSVYYVDKELGEKKAREIDLVIKIPFKKKCEQKIHEFTLYLVADVKSVSDPIVMLSSSPTMPDRQAVFRGEFAYYSNSPSTPTPLRQKVVTPIESFNSKGRITRQVLKIIKDSKKEKHNRINDSWFRESAFSTVKATRYFSKIYSETLEFDLVFGSKSSCFLTMPLVIVDGILHEHYYGNKGECLEPVQYCLARFSVPKDLTSEKSESVDPVTHEGLIVCSLSHLREFLDNVKSFVEKTAPEIIDYHVKSTKQRIKESESDET